MRVLEEKQRFNQWWLQLINLAIFGFLLFACYTWFVRKEDMGNVAQNDTAGQIITISILTITVLLLFLFRLETIIDERGILYKFSPIHLKYKVVGWNDLEKCYVRKYNPLSEYGGWGYRIGFSGGAYNVKGNQGIQLKFKSGKKLLIGTQKPKDAQLVINKYFKNEGVQGS